MFDQLVERFCEFDDFCNAVRAEWKAMLLSNSKAADRQYGPEGGLADSEIMTVLVLYHSSRFKNFKTFYNGIVLGLLRACFPRRSLLRAFYCTYEPRVDAFGFFPRQPDGPEDGHRITSTAHRCPSVINRRIAKHKEYRSKFDHAHDRGPLRVCQRATA